MEPVRLQKFLSERGICSRRQAEELIEIGEIVVNGKPAVLGQKVDPEKDHVSVEGRRVRHGPMEKVTLMLNKPRGYVCTNDDPHAEKTVFDLLESRYLRDKLFCAGRLDKESQGLVILTNDGELAQAITHPSGGVVKRYQVKLNKPFDEALIPRLLRGVRRDGERLFADKVIPAKHGPDAEIRLDVHLRQGRKREIRRLFEAFGYLVKRLKRYQIGTLKLGKLPPGKARPLNAEDIEKIFRA